MRTVEAYVENGVALAADHGSAAWAFDLDLWGVAGQGPDERAALSDLARRTGAVVVPVERITGDERAFVRDHEPALAEEVLATLVILADVRAQTLEFLVRTPDAVLDWDDAGRDLPAFASWRTLRAMAWHIADTESRYYLPRAGLPARDRRTGLVEELIASHEYVRSALTTMPPDLVRRTGDEIWTSTKVLRRLAWHERGELAAMRDLAARCVAGRSPIPGRSARS